ncbi:hypothetical protein ACTXGQ_35740, partial [Marinobacter sp. 1Y8]
GGRRRRRDVASWGVLQPTEKVGGPVLRQATRGTGAGERAALEQRGARRSSWLDRVRQDPRGSRARYGADLVMRAEQK